MGKAAIATILALSSTALYGAVEDSSQVFRPEGFAVEPPEESTDSLDRNIMIIEGDTIHTSFIEIADTLHCGPLTDDDYRAIAEDLGVESAAIRAVVDIETGKKRKGFHTDGMPVINFDLAVFRRASAKRGINLSKYHKSHPVVFSRPQIRKYGSLQAAQYARLESAITIDSIAAMESTFWGMFQIGGFNWKLCGAESRADFVEQMKRSEYDQLRLFANYIRNAGLLRHLKSKNWAAFAKRYNGPAYAARGYHTRMAAAYRRHKAEGH